MTRPWRWFLLLAAAGTLLPLSAAADDAEKAARKTAALARLKKQSIAVTQENLMHASMGEDAALITTLLDAGLDPNVKDEMLNRTVLSMATMSCLMDNVPAAGRDAVIGALLAGGADPNSVEMGEVPILVYVAQKCPRSVVDLFVKAGAKLDGRTPQGFTPLSMALVVGNLDAAEALLDHGARLSEEARTKLFPEPPADPRAAALLKRAQSK